MSHLTLVLRTGTKSSTRSVSALIQRVISKRESFLCESDSRVMGLWDPEAEDSHICHLQTGNAREPLVRIESNSDKPRVIEGTLV